MRILQLVLSLVFALGLTACNGTSGENGDDPFGGGTTPSPAEPEIALQLEVLAVVDGQCTDNGDVSFTVGESLCLQASLTQDGAAINNARIDFTAEQGLLTADSALTDSNGIASVTLDSASASTGVASATASYNETSASANFELLPGDLQASYVLSLSMQDSEGTSLNSFSADQQVSLVAVLNDENEAPVAGEIIEFSAQRGILAASSALSDEQGMAVVTLTGDPANLGAGVASAQLDKDGDIYTATLNYQVVAAAPPDEPELIVSLLNEDCTARQNNSLQIGEIACIEALLAVDGEPLPGEVVNFSAGLGVLSSATKLTDNMGIARVSLDGETATAGAAQLIASVQTATAALNYEFLDTPPTAPTLPSISLTMLDTDGDAVTRFKADQQVSLRTEVTDADSNPLSNIIVRYQVEKGILATSDALTNDQGIAEVILTGDPANLGAGVASAQFSIDDQVFIDSLNFEIQSPDAVGEQLVKFGYFDGDTFVDNEIGASLDGPISAGGTLGLSVAVVSETDGAITRILTPTPVTFSSVCVQSGDANIDQQVVTVNGEASTTYEDLSCAGGSGNFDTISAAITVNNATQTITRQVELLPETTGALEFVSAQPDSIVLLGTGGQGSESISTVTFQVNGELGNPLAQQQVYFALNTEIGGLTLSPQQGLTNSLGQVSTRVTAGNVPTAVRVTAETYLCTTSDGTDQEACSLEQKQACEVDADCEATTIRTQSDLLTVNTGLPDQNSMTLAADNLNPEAFDINGQQVQVTASLADSFNNPVPDGTAVAFTTEGGFIEPSCTTISGRCSVTWTSANPRPADHRVTVLATAVGHETLVDSNGNNVYDDDDGPADTSVSGSGFDTALPQATGFFDLPEAWRDDDEDNDFDAGTEVFLDFDGDGEYSPANGEFDGPQCIASNCGLSGLHVRKAMVIVMSGSTATIVLADTDGLPGSGTLLPIARGSSASYQLEFGDSADQTLANDSTVVVNSTAGTLGGEFNIVVPNTNRNDVGRASFSLVNDLALGDDPIDAIVTVTATSPSGVVSSRTFTVPLQ